MVIVNGKQNARDAQLDMFVGSDWAGDVQHRRSTTGMHLMRGSRLLKHSATLQSSTAEAEYYALVRGRASD